MDKYLTFTASILLDCFVFPMFYFISNYPQFGPLDTFLIITLFGAISLGIAGLLWILFRDINKVSFLMYGGGIVFWCSHPVASFLRDHFYFFGKFAGNRLQWPLLFLCCISFVFCLFFVLKYFQKSIRILNKVLGIFIFSLCGLLLLNGCQKLFLDCKNMDKLAQKQQINTDKRYPNVYHILLDAHPNQEAMKIIGGDLKPFYRDLEALGFITFPESRSNYAGTRWSVASMLNMDYICENFKEKSIDYFRKLIQNNKVFKHFRNFGYNLHIITADRIVGVLYGPHRNSNQKVSILCELNSIIERTPMKHLYQRTFSEVFKKQSQALIEGQFLDMITPRGSSMYTYVHILCPHEPCIFTHKATHLAFSGFITQKDSSYLLAPETHRLYCENIYGIDNLTLNYIKKLLEQYNATTPKPIIVLHSDHSILNNSDLVSPFITPDTKYGNLLALYIPDEWKQDAKDLKFINLYRWIFNHLFGDKFEYFEENLQK